MDNLNFDLNFDFSKPHIHKSAQIEQQVVNSKAHKRFVKNEERHYAAAKALADLCDEPQEGEQWRILTEKAFNAYAFICHLLTTGNIDELYLAIYRINEPTVAAITQMLDDGRIKHANFIISSFFNQTKKPERWHCNSLSIAQLTPTGLALSICTTTQRWYVQSVATPTSYSKGQAICRITPVSSNTSTSGQS